MTDSVRPIGAISARDRRAAERRTAERREQAGHKPGPDTTGPDTTGPDKTGQDRTASASRDLVPVGEVVDHTPPGDPATSAARTRKARSAATGAAAFAAQILGQGGQRNGIRGGPPVMDAARATYLGAQYSGEQERRPPSGTTKRTKV